MNMGRKVSIDKAMADVQIPGETYVATTGARGVNTTGAAMLPPVGGSIGAATGVTSVDVIGASIARLLHSHSSVTSDGR